MEKTFTLTVDLAFDIVCAENVCNDEGIGPYTDGWSKLVTDSCDLVLSLSDEDMMSRGRSRFEIERIKREVVK
jgi:hypothetical protein